MTKLVDLLDQFKYRRTFGFFDDFDALASGQRWTADPINSGSVTLSAAPTGIASLVPSGGSPAAHDQTYLATTQPLFAFAADRPLVFEAALQFTEANTNQADVMLGLIAGGVGAGVIQDSGAPQASYTGMVFYKNAGSTIWNCQSSVGSASHRGHDAALRSGRLSNAHRPVAADQRHPGRSSLLHRRPAGRQPVDDVRRSDRLAAFRGRGQRL